MNIRFISSLTPDDEDLIAPALLKAVAALLDPLDFAYSLKIETTGSRMLQHMHPAALIDWNDRPPRGRRLDECD